MTDCSFYITVKPRSPKTAVMRMGDGIVVRVNAPPVEGAANTAVIAALAQALHLPKSRLSITAGATGKVKRVTVSNLAQSELSVLLEALPQG